MPLGRGPSAVQVLHRASGSDGLLCLHGSWGDQTGAVIVAQPLLVADPADPIAALGVLPQVDGIEAALIGGGWFGVLAYDGPSQLAFYDHLLRVDAGGQWWFEALWSAERDALLHERRLELQALLTELDTVEQPDPKAAQNPAWSAGLFGGAPRAAHLAAVEEAIGLIRAGEIYQTNICTRLQASFAGSPVAAFGAVVTALQPAYGAFVEGPSRTILSLSPELFVRRRGRDVSSALIKGTWPRSDPAGAQSLAGSAKDTAENVMIVDLVRNDLGRVCEPGSVRVPALLEVQPHPGVWHLVSTVAGLLRPEVDDAGLLRAVFPPGSVTGAPKIRAQAAIADVEAGPRGAYTGAIGFVSPCLGDEFAVAIRTFEVESGGIALGVGGGITAGSVPMLEWQECLLKAAALIAALGSGLAADVLAGVAVPSATQRAGGLLETILAVDGVPLRLADHLARLDRSSREIYGRGVPDDLTTRVQGAATEVGAARAAVRLVLGCDGRVDVAASPAAEPVLTSAVRTARRTGGLWRHKWAERTELATLEVDGVMPLFLAADGAVLETSRGNVFLLLADRTLVTPPLRDDLLPGITRQALLDHARDGGRAVQLREFGLDELARSAAFWTSSLSGAVPITSVDAVPLPRRDAEIAAFGQLLRSAGHPPTR